MRRKAVSIVKLSPKFKVILKDTSAEILPMLLGMELLWNINPHQYLFQLEEDVRTRIIASLRLSGYIEGQSEHSWKFTSKLYKKVVEHLASNPESCEFMGIAKKAPPITLKEIVVTYSRLLKKVPKQFRTPACFRAAPALRKVIHRNDPALVLACMPDFFRAAASSTNNFEPFELEKFAKTYKAKPTSSSGSGW